jgi:hypothetical protein
MYGATSDSSGPVCPASASLISPATDSTKSQLIQRSSVLVSQESVHFLDSANTK